MPQTFSADLLKSINAAHTFPHRHAQRLENPSKVCPYIDCKIILHHIKSAVNTSHHNDLPLESYNELDNGVSIIERKSLLCLYKIFLVEQKTGIHQIFAILGSI